MSFEESVKLKQSEYRQKLNNILAIQDDADLKMLVDAITLSAANAEMNAAYGGAHHDGGAGTIFHGLDTFLAGVAYGKSGIIEGKYADIMAKIKAQSDPQYKLYQELKAKFKDLE